MKKHFFEKTSYTVFTVIVIVVMLGCFALNVFGQMSMKMLRIIVGPLGLISLGTYVYIVHCAIKEKKLRNEKSQSREPKVCVQPASGILTKLGDAIIDIDGFKYYIESPFRKEGTTPKTSDTFYSYLSSLPLLEPIAGKMIKWFKKDMGLSDTIVNEYGLCYCFRDLRVIDSKNPLFICYVHNENMRMIVAIELLERNVEVRGLEHISALIKAVDIHERANYAGQGLLDAFSLFKNGEMTPKVFKNGKSIGYCFLYKS